MSNKMQNQVNYQGIPVLSISDFSQAVNECYNALETSKNMKGFCEGCLNYLETSNKINISDFVLLTDRWNSAMKDYSWKLSPKQKSDYQKRFYDLTRPISEELLISAFDKNILPYGNYFCNVKKKFI